MARFALTFTAAAVSLAAAALLPVIAVHLPWAWELGSATGHLAALGLLALLALPVRMRSGAPHQGLELARHRDAGLLIGALLLAHVGVLLLRQPLLIEYLKPTAPLYMLSGLLALVLVLFLIGSGFAAVRHRLWRSHRRFQITHVGLSLATVLLTAAHVAGSARYLDGLAKRAIWMAASAGALLCLVRIRRTARAATPGGSFTARYRAWRERAAFGRYAGLMAGFLGVAMILLAALLDPRLPTLLRETLIARTQTLPLDFPHARHTKVNCLKCHHNYIDGRGSDACISCHRSARTDLVLAAEPRFHGFCMDCHLDKARSAEHHGPIRACSACHRPADSAGQAAGSDAWRSSS